MNFAPVGIPGVRVVGLEPLADERGFFARTWDADEYRADGLADVVTQASISFNVAAHTLRGMHYQAAPHEEEKTVRCTRGSVFDVVVDMRPDSPTFRRWHGVELSADNRLALYIPAGCAHGFLTLEPSTELLYLISAPYHPASARGVRWDDPAIGIEWPAVPAVMSDRDRTYPSVAP